ncbi:hypothetical protein BIY37_04835 [Candidatus Brocadia sapporoensis]|uniref:Uncharacterized protein n=1 Tax=Candidatus Brocadia sapporoensis TaxID=392547 RepID=A0A1V6M191_9BACT|nr:hypothetical protein BIY37_04835 [Candidatus Brocadia sapporoensis]GJQ23566.1 MAG: hypothetical protein HBSAPP01_13560 [Candidatus Brocadia sapporoensis]
MDGRESVTKKLGCLQDARPGCRSARRVSQSACKGLEGLVQVANLNPHREYPTTLKLPDSIGNSKKEREVIDGRKTGFNSEGWAGTKTVKGAQGI